MSKVFAGIVALLAITALSAADTVTLKGEAYVKGPNVTLGDIADIQGEHAEALSLVQLAPAAIPGGSKKFDTAMLKSRIATAGLPVDTLEFSGPASTVATTLHNELTPDMMSAELRTFIESEMPWNPDDTSIDIAVPTQEIMVPDGALEIRWWPNPQYRWVGPGVFRGEIQVDGEVKRTVLLRAEIEAYADVLVAATDIPRGKLISASDIQIEKRAMSMLKGSVLSRMDEVAGQVARSTIFPGQVITSRQLAPRQLVKRNQNVTVEAKAGGLVVRSQARALMNACAGDVIVCMNPDSKEEFQGTVRGDGVVVVE